MHLPPDIREIPIDDRPLAEFREALRDYHYMQLTIPKLRHVTAMMVYDGNGPEVVLAKSFYELDECPDVYGTWALLRSKDVALPPIMITNVGEPEVFRWIPPSHAHPSLRHACRVVYPQPPWFRRQGPVLSNQLVELLEELQDDMGHIRPRESSPELQFSFMFFQHHFVCWVDFEIAEPAELTNLINVASRVLQAAQTSAKAGSFPTRDK